MSLKPNRLWHDGGRVDSAYARYNRLYFGGRLPRDLSVLVVRIGRGEWRLPRHRLAELRFRLGRPAAILLNSYPLELEGTRTRLALLHEMVHLDLWQRFRYEGHGPKFQRGMLRLARAGAFRHLW